LGLARNSESQVVNPIAVLPKEIGAGAVARDRLYPVYLRVTDLRRRRLQFPGGFLPAISHFGRFHQAVALDVMNAEPFPAAQHQIEVLHHPPSVRDVTVNAAVYDRLPNVVSGMCRPPKR